MLEMKDQMRIEESNPSLRYISLSIFNSLLFWSVFGSIWNVIHIRRRLGFTALTSNNEKMTENALTFNNSIILMDLISGEFFPAEKDVTVKLLIPQVFTVLIPQRCFCFLRIKPSSTLSITLCLPYRKITSFSTAVRAVKVLTPERISTRRCSIILLPACCGAGLGTSTFLAQWRNKVQ